MAMVIYEPYELIQLLDAINCLEDIQHYGEILTNYPELFGKDLPKYKRVLLQYADLWTI